MIDSTHYATLFAEIYVSGLNVYCEINQFADKKKDSKIMIATRDMRII